MTAHTDDSTQQSDPRLEVNSTPDNPTIKVEIQTDPVSQLRLYAAFSIYIDWLLEQAAETRETESAA